MNPTLRQLLRAAVLVACLAPVLTQAADAHKRELSAAAPGSHGAQPAPNAAAVVAQQQLQKLGLEAALLDSSAFGQLRILRNFEATAVHAPAGGESCH